MILIYYCQKDNHFPSPFPHPTPPSCAGYGLSYTVDALRRRENWVMVELALRLSVSDLLIKFIFNIVTTSQNQNTSLPPRSPCAPQRHWTSLIITGHDCDVTYRIVRVEDGFELTLFTQLLIYPVDSEIKSPRRKAGSSRWTNLLVKEEVLVLRLTYLGLVCIFLTMCITTIGYLFVMWSILMGKSHGSYLHRSSHLIVILTSCVSRTSEERYSLSRRQCTNTEAEVGLLWQSYRQRLFLTEAPGEYIPYHFRLI